MEVWQAALWGFAGGFCVELWNLQMLTREARFSWRCPIPQGLSAYLTAVATRLALGAIIAAAAAAGDEIRGVWIAFGLGVAAPVVLQRVAGDVPLTGGEELKPRTRAPAQVRSASGKEPQPVTGNGDDDGNPL
jgi:cytochrome c biogenesis protein CcdA